MEKKKNLILALFLVVVILLGVCAYLLLYKPYITNLQTQAAQSGIAYVLNYIGQPLASCKTIILPYGNNTYLNVTEVNCIGRWS